MYNVSVSMTIFLTQYDVNKIGSVFFKVWQRIPNELFDVVENGNTTISEKKGQEFTPFSIGLRVTKTYLRPYLDIFCNQRISES